MDLGLAGKTGGLSYGPLKAAVVNYMSRLAKERGPDGIRADAVSPGPMSSWVLPVWAISRVRSPRDV